MPLKSGLLSTARGPLPQHTAALAHTHSAPNTPRSHPLHTLPYTTTTRADSLPLHNPPPTPLPTTRHSSTRWRTHP
eukprot:2340925-Rhodomonas_salina.2